MNNTDLWDAINHYCVACGGSPATRIYGNVERQRAVVAVEKAICETTENAMRKVADVERQRAVVAVEKAICETTENAMRKVADAARDLLSVTGEIDDDGAFQACPQSTLSIADREAIVPWVEEKLLPQLVKLFGHDHHRATSCT